MRVLNPLIPFITEEVWQQLCHRSEADCLMISDYPTPKPFDKEIITSVEQTFQVVKELKSTLGTPTPKVNISLIVQDPKRLSIYEQYGFMIKKLIRGELQINTNQTSPHRFMANQDACYVLTNPNSDAEQSNQSSKLARENLEKELHYLQGFLHSVEKKLNNPNFTARAPQAIIDIENQKKQTPEPK